MGGFAGGDEAGFWDEESLPYSVDKHTPQVSKSKQQSLITYQNSIYSLKAHTKKDIFFKITGEIDAKPTFHAKMVCIDHLYNTISLVPHECREFTLSGCNEMELESTSIHKAYKALLEYTNDSDIIDFFHQYKVVVNRETPSQKDLGSNASNAAAFLRLTKEACNLILSNEELANIGISVDYNIPFFIYNYPCANVSGIGEQVEYCDSPMY